MTFCHFQNKLTGLIVDSEGIPTAVVALCSTLVVSLIRKTAINFSCKDKSRLPCPFIERAGKLQSH